MRYDICYPSDYKWGNINGYNINNRVNIQMDVIPIIG